MPIRRVRAWPDLDMAFIKLKNIGMSLGVAGCAALTVDIFTAGFSPLASDKGARLREGSVGGGSEKSSRVAWVSIA